MKKMKYLMTLVAMSAMLTNAAQAQNSCAPVVNNCDSECPAYCDSGCASYMSAALPIGALAVAAIIIATTDNHHHYKSGSGKHSGSSSGSSSGHAHYDYSCSAY